MKANPVVWFEIYVNDIQRAKRFYESVFQTTLEKLESPAPDIEMFSFPMEQNVRGAGGTICKMQGFSPGANGTLIYFQCDDCAVEETRVKQFGGRVEKPKMSIGQYGAISLVYDTEGNMIGLHSMK
jgi:predicted enzyme related to lactoylglutathione lyase